MKPIIQKIDSNNLDLLRSFIDSLGVETETFRYFKSRELSVINNHLLTILLLVDGEPVGYGHLDIDGDKVWLGIVVKNDFRGKGLGTKIMEELIKQAKALNVKELSLTVDTNNDSAIGLYERFGFKLIKVEGGHKLYSLILNQK